MKSWISNGYFLKSTGSSATNRWFFLDIDLLPCVHGVVERGFRSGKALGFWLQLDFIGSVKSSGLQSSLLVF